MERGNKTVTRWLAAGAAAAVLALAAVVLGIVQGPVLLLPRSVAVQAVEQTLQCACTGDYGALGQMLYGSPDLGQTPAPSEQAQSQIWYAFLESVQYRLEEGWTVEQDQVALEARLTCLDIAAVNEALAQVLPQMLSQSVAQAQDMAEVYEEDHSYRQDFVQRVAAQAAAQVLEDPPTMERTLPLRLARQDGEWRVVPTQELLAFLSGYVDGR